MINSSGPGGPPNGGWPGQPGPPPQGPPQPWQPNPGGYPGHGADQPPQQPDQPGGFDPRRSLGPGQPDHVSINEFAPPKNRTPMLITIVSLVVLALVVGAGWYLQSRPITSEPSPTPSAAQTGPGQPFTTPDGRSHGRWQILDHTWTSEGLQIRVTLASDDRNISYSFLAFDNGTLDIIDATTASSTPDVSSGTLVPTRPVTGYVFFPMSRGDATVVLATGTGRQMSALPVKG